MTVRELDDFQREVIEFGNRRGRFIYADPMGARKTATTLTFLAQRPGVQRVIIVCPSGVIKHWADECWEWFPDAAPWIGQGPKREQQLHAALTSPKTAVYITTYDAMKVDEDNLAGQFDTWVFDEGHRLKGRTTAVAKSAYRVTKTTTNILCVTGTPMLNHPEELWFYLHMMFRKTFTSFWSWAREHFKVTLEQNRATGGSYEKIGDFLPGHAEILRKQLETVLLQRELEEILPDAPWIVEPNFEPHYVELSDEERKHYDRLVKHSWAQFPSKVVTAANKLVVTTRMKQMASDWGNLDATLEHGTKVTYAVGCIAALARNGPVVVFTEYVETAERIIQGLVEEQHLIALPYTGKQTPTQRDMAKVSFSHGHADVIVGTYGSMKEGVDGLQFASRQMVLVDLLWVAGLVDQAIGRLRRDGQTGQIDVHLIVARNTIDPTVLRANLRKVNVVKTLKGRPILDIVYGVNPDIDYLED